MSSVAEYQLSIEPVKVTMLPSEDTVLAQGRALLDGARSWNKGKTFHKVVHTYSRPKYRGEAANWHCRVSAHPAEDATFDELWDKLAVNKGENEVQYVDMVKKATLIKQLSPGQAIWSMFYRFPPPVSPRVFTVLQTTRLVSSSPRTCVIVSVPVDLSSDPALAQLEEQGVKARYVSIEEFSEADGGGVEWRMATSSRAEGFIPQFLTERSIPGNIAHDVPGLLKWLKTLRKPANGKAAQPEPAADAQATPVGEPAAEVTQPGADPTNLAPVVVSPAAGNIAGPVP